MSGVKRPGVEACDHLPGHRKTDQARERKILRMDGMACGRRIKGRTMWSLKTNRMAMS